jgi:hypothetical protein
LFNLVSISSKTKINHQEKRGLRAVYKPIILILFISICVLLVSCGIPTPNKITPSNSNSVPITIPSIPPSSWSIQYTLAQKYILHSLWGSSANDIYAVGNTGAVLHYDGKNWNEIEVGTFSNLNGVWGSSKNDVYVVGDQSIYNPGRGIILHYNGISWSTLTVSQPLNAIWGTSSSDIFAVGSSPSNNANGTLQFGVGAILHYDGKNWNKMDVNFDTKTDSGLNGIWGTSSSDVFAVGNGNTTVWHYDGDSWHSIMISLNPVVNLSPQMGFAYIWGTSDKDVYVVGGGDNYLHSIYFALHYDGKSWEAIPGINEPFSCIWGSSSSNIFLGGREQSSHQPLVHIFSVIQHFNGNNWNRQLVPSSDNNIPATISIKYIWGSSASNVYAVDSVGDILHYSGK